MGRLSGKVAIVTGGASGIGEAIARMFVKEGASVAVADIQDTVGAALVKDLGAACAYIRTDVSRADQVRNMVAETVKRFGRLDILVNSAGIIYNGVPIVEHSEEDFDRTIAINLKGVWLAIKHAFAELEKSGAGAVINIASIAGVVGNPGQTAYGASKGGVVQLTRHCATEGAGKHIRVNCISPGGIVTAMSYGLRPGQSREQVHRENAERNPLQRTGLPDDIAYAAVWLASDESAHVTAQNIVIDAGVTLIRKKIQRNAQDAI